MEIHQRLSNVHSAVRGLHVYLSRILAPTVCTASLELRQLKLPTTSNRGPFDGLCTHI